MGMIGWYKRDPAAALRGMRSLTPEQRGIYNTVLDLIYDSANELIDDDRFVAGNCNCDIRVYRRVKKHLIEAEKLYVAEGFLRNYTADEAVANLLAKHVSNRNAALIKHGKLNPEDKKNKDLVDAHAHADAHAKPVPYKNKNKKDSNPPISPPSEGKKKSSRKTSFPDGFCLTGEMREYASKQTPNVDVDLDFEKFRDHHLSKGNKFVSWPLAWKNWCRSGFAKPMLKSTGVDGYGRSSSSGQSGAVADALELAFDDEGGRGKTCSGTLAVDGPFEGAGGKSKTDLRAVDQAPDGAPDWPDDEGYWDSYGNARVVAGNGKL